MLGAYENRTERMLQYLVSSHLAQDGANKYFNQLCFFFASYAMYATFYDQSPLIIRFLFLSNFKWKLDKFNLLKTYKRRWHVYNRLSPLIHNCLYFLNVTGF